MADMSGKKDRPESGQKVKAERQPGASGTARDRGSIAFTLRQLQYFTAAAEHASVVGAAAALNVSPASVSAAINHLETVCGLQLFVRRHARGLVLTPTGSDMVIEASNLLHLAIDFQDESRKRSQTVQGRLEIGVLVSFAATLTPQIVRRFLDAYPDAEIRWHQGDLDYLINGLEAGRLELALMYDFDLPSTLRRMGMLPLPPKVILPRTHRLAGQQTVSLQEIVEEPYILLDLPRTRDYFLSIFAELGLTPNVAYRESSVEMLRSLVANEFGYSILNYVSEAELQRGTSEIVTIPLDREVRGTALSAVWHYRYRMNRLAQAFLDCAQEFMLERARSEPQGHEG